MGAGKRLKSLKNQYKLPFICIKEPKRKAKHITKLPLWEELQVLSTTLKGPWGVIGDFNVITSPEEKHGGACYNMQKSVFMVPSTLGATTEGTQEQSGKNSIDCSLMKNVKDVWIVNTQGTAMWKQHNKMKVVATKLSSWSRETFGDIFKDVKEAEKQVTELEKKLTENNNEENRANLSKTKADFIRLLKNQDEIYRQKAKTRWLKDGDKNTSYFHKVIKDRRRKLNIQSIQDNEGHKIEGHQNIATTTIKHFEGLFSYQEAKGSFRILDIVPKLVTEEMYAMLIAIPTPRK
ncbi:uncharacterized protein LOC132611672 [Lycium barbarum]|uniref:uncharacterized protein LOC132611672 n=1 Tax=Lycium barbarum TaxID=112863 RepID=UPI00293F3DD8|nr:uncharacterized protein LOC132611672 [Lycium barbarum]